MCGKCVLKRFPAHGLERVRRDRVWSTPNTQQTPQKYVLLVNHQMFGEGLGVGWVLRLGGEVEDGGWG